MGVYIYMNVLPNEIKQEDWEAVYEESLELVRAYPFLDDNVDWDSYEEPWQYGIYSDEVILDKNQLGWHIFGDYPTMMSAESFAIYRDIKNYRKITQYNYGNKDQENVKCRDILAVPLNKYVLSNELEIPIDNVYVFDGKTQRFPHHKYVLAIACLFECRFPEYVYVDGDISTEEKNNAINWANTILNKSIQLTEPLSNETLLRRIRSIVKDESAVLDAFMTLPVRRESYSLEMLKEQFSDEVIMADCIDDFRKDRPVEIGFGYSLERFFNLGFSVEKACDICVLDQNGCQYDAQDFAEVTLSLNWNDQQDREEPWDDLRPNHSTEEVAAILENKLGARIDLTPPKEAEQKEKTEQDYVQEFLRDLLIKGAGEQVIPEYTFSNIDYLAFWKEGDSLHPNVEKRLQKLKDTTIEIRENNKDTFDQFNECSEYDRIKWLISLNRYFLIRKDYWDYYIDNINQTDLSNTLFNILLVDAREIYTNHLCRALLNNRALLERFMI